MDNVGIVVEDIDDAIEFFTELGLIREAAIIAIERYCTPIQTVSTECGTSSRLLR